MIMKLRQVLAGVLSALLLFVQVGIPVYAEEPKEKEPITEEEEKAASYAEEIDTNEVEGWPQGPAIYAASGIIMDMKSGTVLYAKNPDEKMYPASITKLLSVLVALNHAQLTDKVTFSEESISFLESDDANIGMNPGEELSMEDALYGMLLASANEVSYAVAENVGNQYLGGGYDAFIEEMNRTAEALGCKNSHWVNANGLHDENHYTTVYDMGLIASAVYQNEEFRKLESTLEHKIPSTNLINEERILYQNHKMLWPENYYYYEYAKAGKTGYTDQSKTTLVTMADNEDLQLAAVVLHTYGVDAYEDTQAMFEYAFNNFTKISLAEMEDTQEIESFDDAEAYIVVPNGVEFSDLEKEYIFPEEADGRHVTVAYTYEGQNVGSAGAVLSESTYMKLTEAGTETETDVVNENIQDTEQKRNPKVVLFVFLVGILFVLYIITVIALYKRKLKKRRHKKMKRR